MTGLRGATLRAGAFFAAFFGAPAFLGAAFFFTATFAFDDLRGTARVAVARFGFAVAGLRFATDLEVAVRLVARDPERLRLFVTALMESFQLKGKWSQPCEDAVAE